ncbi:MAG: nucleotidyltransferase family protein [Clostridia bacterium]|nr:nucleotidyltransferase family protein [Clostridia bacterium]
MKFCAVVCEYNPFHNGHRFQLSEIRRISGCDKILCIMSGNFTQRGEAAVLHKYERAKHAVECGADMVIELPTAFAVSSAELFAKGAVHILGSIPAVSTLAFGCESGDKESFLTAAKATLNESKEFKAALKENMKGGTSYIRARNEAVLAFHDDVDESLLSSPNNVLGTEYCRAILAEKKEIEPLPIPRVGGGYADTSLFKNFSSATALRACLKDDTRKSKKALKRNVPEQVLGVLQNAKELPFETAALCALAAAPAEEIAKCPDCSEGLENRLKNMARSNPEYESALDKIVSKRYTLSRLKRILAQNFLGVHLKDVRSYAESPLYYKVLAVKKTDAEELLGELANGAYPAIVRKSDYNLLKKDALACFATDVHANDLYNALSGTYTNEFDTLFV